MSLKLDIRTLNQYSQEYSDKICNDFFKSNAKVSGADLSKITPVQQVNMLVIRGLYENWKSTTSAFRSPFFDFENEEVQSALQSFMNVVSQHIAVDRENFQPILTKAVAETLSFGLNPADFLEGYLRELPDFQFTAERASELSKYFKINTTYIDALKSQLANQPNIYVTEALSALKAHDESTEIKNDESILGALSQTLPCDLAKFVKGAKTEKSQSFFDAIVDGTEAVAARVNLEPKVEEPTKIIEPIIVAQTVERVIPEVNEEKTPILKAESQPNTVNDQFSTETPNLNEVYKSEQPNLADFHQNSPVKDLAGSISLNQKFIFINQLFNGDSQAYHETLAILESCSSPDEALDLLRYKYAPKYKWNLNSDEADELMDIIKRKG